MCLPREPDALNADGDPNLFFPALMAHHPDDDLPRVIITPPTPPIIQQRPSPPAIIDEVSLLLDEVPLLVDMANNVPPIQVDGDYTEDDLRQMAPDVAHQHRLRLDRIRTFNALMSDTRNRLRLIQGILRPYARRPNPPPAI